MLTSPKTMNSLSSQISFPFLFFLLQSPPHTPPFLSLSLLSPPLFDLFDTKRYKCVYNDNDVERIEVEIKKFRFVKLPKQYLQDAQVNHSDDV